MRGLLWVVALFGVAGCAGFRTVERGQWALVYVDSAQRGLEAPREVIPRDSYEAEVAEGTRRGWQPPTGFVFPQLHETDAIGLQAGDVAGFRVDEQTEAELFVDGSAVELFWGPVQKRDGWNVDTDVTIKESALYVKGLRAGKATLRLVRGSQERDVPVTVK
jgi:hypothetical protein